jgi:hypothetical protein
MIHVVFLMIAGKRGTGRKGPIEIVALDPKTNTWNEVELAVAEGVDVLDAGAAPPESGSIYICGATELALDGSERGSGPKKCWIDRCKAAVR